MANHYKGKVSQVIGRDSGITAAGKDSFGYVAGAILVVKTRRDGIFITSLYSFPKSFKSQLEHEGFTRMDSGLPAKEHLRPKKVVSIAISAGDELLAAGEQGLNPRICIWDLQNPDPNASLLHTINCHSFGVRLLAFCPQARYLASVGFIHDGSIHIWDTRGQAKTRVASNKVTSNLSALIWVGNKVVTIGTRHIKVWQWQDSRNSSARQSATDAIEAGTILEGRNVVLGPLVHDTFLAVSRLDMSRCLVATKNTVSLLHLEDIATLTSLLVTEDEITAVAAIPNSLHFEVGYGNGLIKQFTFSDSPESCPVGQQLDVQPELSKSNRSIDHRGISGIIFIDKLRIVADASGGLHLTSVEESAASKSIRLSPSCTTACLCVCTDSNRVQLWHADGHSFAIGELETITTLYKLPHRVSVLVQISPVWLVYGLATGEIALYNIQDGAEAARLVAHSGEISCMKLKADGSAIATAGRDKMLQVFAIMTEENSVKLELLQTFDEHTSQISAIIWV